MGNKHGTNQSKDKEAFKSQRTTKIVEEIYHKMAPVYNFIYGKLLFNEGREEAIDLLDIRPGNRVLEVGVGTGLTLPLYPDGCEVTGVDLSEAMLKEADSLMKKKHIKNAKVRQMDATNLEFPDSYFDRVLGNLFISATTYPEKSLLEMKRVCKPRGMIVLMNHFKSDQMILGMVENALNPISQGLGFKANLEMRPLLASVGLRPKEVRKVNMLNLWTAVSMVNEK